MMPSSLASKAQGNSQHDTSGHVDPQYLYGQGLAAEYCEDKPAKMTKPSARLVGSVQLMNFTKLSKTPRPSSIAASIEATSYTSVSHHIGLLPWPPRYQLCPWPRRCRLDEGRDLRSSPSPVMATTCRGFVCMPVPSELLFRT